MIESNPRENGDGWEQELHLVRRDMRALQGEVRAMGIQLGEVRTLLAQALGERGGMGSAASAAVG